MLQYKIKIFKKFSLEIDTIYISINYLGLNLTQDYKTSTQKTIKH